MKSIFDETSLDCSKRVTKSYSTSFSLAINMLAPSVRDQVYAIYGFVRLADEIVDSFEGYDQEKLFDKFEKDYLASLHEEISLNPILNAFQKIVNQYKLHDLVDAFMASMRADLYKKEYHTTAEYEQYIYGSADVVGLMCLKVFVKGDESEFERLKGFASKLGSAFQKVNFLRDAKHDYESLGRIYFPNVNFSNFSEHKKREIILEIEEDFKEAIKGIRLLPGTSRFGVLTAYMYYLSLLKKIERTNANRLLLERIRIPNPVKMLILVNSYFRYRLNIF
jgi:phytoene/squalene synthetase